MARVALLQDVMIEYMAYMCISAVLKQAGHEVEVFFDSQNDDEKFLEELRAFNPDVVCFSILTPSVPWALRMSQAVKREMDVVTVVGNVHAMMQPEIVEEPGIDLACLGEGERCMTELCQAIDQQQDYTHIAGFWAKRPDGTIRRNPKRTDLVVMDEMPFIDRAMYNKYFFFRHSSYLRVLTGRGCPFRCSFCSNPVMTDHYGGARNYFRKRSPLSAVEEIEHLIKSHPTKVKYVYFVDEVLWIQNEWMREFMVLYNERIKLPFSANFRFGAITEDDIKLLSKCKPLMCLATETGSEEQRRKLLNKPVSDKHILQVGEWMHKYGIKFGSSVFFGLPGDGVQEHIDRLPFFRKLNPTYLWTTFFQPYPGLELTKNMMVQQAMPEGKEFQPTIHHDMYLNLPDRDRLVRLKYVYFLMMRFPWLEKPLLKLTNYNLPNLFKFLFMLHFTYCVILWEHISLMQWLVHIRVLAVNPLLRKKQPLQHSGRPFIPRPMEAMNMPSASPTEVHHPTDQNEHHVQPAELQVEPLQIVSRAGL